MALVQGQGRFVLQDILLDAVTANTTGTWKRLHGMHPFTVTVSGANINATITVYVSNSEAKPSDSDSNWPVLGSALTAVDAIVSDGPYLWAKAAVTNYVAGTISATLCGANNVGARG